MPTETIESYWEDASLPRDSLSRAAERLKSRGSLYLGGGVGVEVKQDGKYNVIGGGTHDGPLSAVTKALTLAGQKKLVGTPGDRTVISDPAIAARIFELDGEKAEVEATIQRMERSLARRAQREMTTYLPTSSMAVDDKTWEQRRIDESKVRLRQIKEERERLLSGKVSEEEGKPGTNFKQVTPAARKKVAPLVRHYMKKPHPFTACVADNTKRFGKERAEKICAVVKDMGKGTTGWRKGNVQEAEVEAWTGKLLEAAGGDVEGVEVYLLAAICEAELASAQADVKDESPFWVPA